jgi:hypothetical protein
MVEVMVVPNLHLHYAPTSKLRSLPGLLGSLPGLLDCWTIGGLELWLD